MTHSDEGQGRPNDASSSFGCYGGEGSSGGTGFVSFGLVSNFLATLISSLVQYAVKCNTRQNKLC